MAPLETEKAGAEDRAGKQKPSDDHNEERLKKRDREIEILAGWTREMTETILSRARRWLPDVSSNQTGIPSNGEFDAHTFMDLTAGWVIAEFIEKLGTLQAPEGARDPHKRMRSAIDTHEGERTFL